MADCIIFGALEPDIDSIKINNGDYIIAADAGLKTVKKLGFKPDLIVGDFDSLDEEPPTGENVIRHPVKKDDTDTLLAIKTALSKGYRSFKIYGCLGGRLDHTFANIQAACYVAENNANAVFIDGTTHLTVLKNNRITFSAEYSGNISVFAVSGIAEGVTVSNLLYELDNATLTPDFPLGVSNEFINKDSLICVNNGKICIIWNCPSGKYIIGGTENE